MPRELRARKKKEDQPLLPEKRPSFLKVSEIPGKGKILRALRFYNPYFMWVFLPFTEFLFKILSICMITIQLSRI